jgi:hypothetical protein
MMDWAFVWVKALFAISGSSATAPSTTIAIGAPSWFRFILPMLPTV